MMTSLRSWLARALRRMAGVLHADSRPPVDLAASFTTEDTRFSRSASMPLLSPEIAQQSRKNLSAILQQLASVGQHEVAVNFGVHESTISRMKEAGAEFERVATLLAAMDMQVNPASWGLCPIDEMNALLIQMHRRLNGMGGANQFRPGE